jgi:hypothetical protein
VTQGVEYYQGKLIVYSLGNFVFDGFDLPAGRTGWLLRLTLDKHGLLSLGYRGRADRRRRHPHPHAGIATPCGQRGDPVIRECPNP